MKLLNTAYVMATQSTAAGGAHRPGWEGVSGADLMSKGKRAPTRLDRVHGGLAWGVRPQGATREASGSRAKAISSLVPVRDREGRQRQGQE